MKRNKVVFRFYLKVLYQEYINLRVIWWLCKRKFLFYRIIASRFILWLMRQIHAFNKKNKFTLLVHTYTELKKKINYNERIIFNIKRFIFSNKLEKFSLEIHKIHS